MPEIGAGGESGLCSVVKADPERSLMVEPECDMVIGGRDALQPQRGAALFVITLRVFLERAVCDRDRFDEFAVEHLCGRDPVLSRLLAVAVGELKPASSRVRSAFGIISRAVAGTEIKV